jgi:hypothetical protein
MAEESQCAEVINTRNFVVNTTACQVRAVSHYIRSELVKIYVWKTWFELGYCLRTRPISDTYTSNSSSIFWNTSYYNNTMTHRISNPAYAIEQWWQSDISKNEMSLMSLIFKNYARSWARRVAKWLSFKNYWHASKWSSIFFSHWQCPSDGDFSFPRFVDLLIKRN